MKLIASVRSLSLAAFLLLAAVDANAVALTGGVVSLVGGSGSCNKSQLVPLDTPQDTFALLVSTACGGGSASGELRSDASSTSVGLHMTVSGTGAQAAADVSLIDHWTIGVPVGTAAGTVFTLPASFRLEGDIASGSTFGLSFGRFLDYGISLGQLGSLSGILQRTGQVVSTGHFDQTFSGPVSFTYFGPGVPTMADFEMQLFVFDLTQGDIDFSHTLSGSLTLPPGFTASSSSGTPLFVSSPVPEPEAVSLMLLGLIVVATAGVRLRRARSHGAAIGHERLLGKSAFPPVLLGQDALVRRALANIQRRFLKAPAKTCALAKARVITTCKRRGAARFLTTRRTDTRAMRA